MIHKKYLFSVLVIGFLAATLLIPGVNAELMSTTTDGAYTIVTWTYVSGITGNNTWTVPVYVTEVEYLVVAGGGQGGGGAGSVGGAGGGGAGGIRHASGFSVSGTLGVTVGDGGTVNSIRGATGGNSAFSTITAYGGTGGAAYGTIPSAGDGGSTGGGGGNPTESTAPPVISPVQGYVGGVGQSAGEWGGGGGGATQAGQTGIGAAGGTAGAGGAGFTSSITGSAVTYAGGGGGGSWTGTGGAGGAGGGGTGASGGVGGTAGTDGLGGGGGGTKNTDYGRDGGSGVVIVRYLTPVGGISRFSSQNLTQATNTTSRGWEGVAPFTMQFTNTSNFVPTSYVWNYTQVGSSNPVTFNSSTFYSPVYTFTSDGNYSIKLNATNPSVSNISTQITWVNVTASPVAAFSANTTTGIVPLAVQFTDASTNATDWYWQLGDGNISTEQNPQHLYEVVGVFNVNLRARSGGVEDWENKTAYITVTEPLTIDYNANILFDESILYVANLTPKTAIVNIVNVTNASFVLGQIEYDPTYWYPKNIRANSSLSDTVVTSSISGTTANYNISRTYGFEATSPLSLVDFDVVYTTYAAPGTTSTWNHTLSSSGTRYFNSTLYEFGIAHEMVTTPLDWEILPEFSGSPLVVSVGTPVNFTDASAGYPTKWSWNFGDLTTSSSQNPSKTYSAIGVYDVTLTASLLANTSVTNSTTKIAYINVTAAPPPAPIAAFSANETTVMLGQPIRFTDESLFTPTSWLWDFGDTGGSIQQSPDYSYSGTGTYNVSLTATNAQGSDSLTKTNYITVIPLVAPVADFTANVTTGAVPLSVQFTDTSTNLPTSWYWQFGDGNTSVLQNPTFTYSAIGDYTVNLTTYNGAGNNKTSKVAYIHATTYSGFNQQDIVMDPVFTLTIHITDSSDGSPIPVSTVTTSDGQSFITTNGTAIFSVPYSVVAVYVTSTGYYGASTSYVMDSDRDETIQLTESRDEYFQPVTSLPKEVQFHVQTLFGAPIPNANVSVYGYVTTTGNWDWVVTLLGMELDKAPINQSTMFGDTDINGDITFLMIPSTKYSVTTTASGYSFTPMNIAVNDRTYTIVSDFNSTGWWGSDTNEQLDVNITVSKTVVNKTYGTINVTYNDPNLVTVSGNIYIYRPNTTRGGANVLVATMPITGNSFQNWTGVPINAITGADYIVQVEAVTST